MWRSFTNIRDLMLQILFSVHHNRSCCNSSLNWAYNIRPDSWILYHHGKAVKNMTLNGSECYHIGIYSIIKKNKTCMLKFNLWLRLSRVQKNGLCRLGVWRLVSLSINRRAFSVGRRASGDPSFSVIRAWATLTVLVCWGSTCWSGYRFGFLLKVCDYYSQVSNCDL